MIQFKRYNLCLLDLICDAKNGQLSVEKIWMHVGNIIMSKIMLTTVNPDVWLFTSYGAIVGGSFVATQFVKWKFRDATPDNKEPAKLGVE